MLHLIGLLAAALALTPQVQVYVNDSEIWILRDGQPSKLTHDGKSKPQAILSPAGDRIAYYEQCPVAEHCKPSVVILDLEGHRLVSFQPKAGAVPPASPCVSILNIDWVRDKAIAAECHINPSLNEYVETDLSTGRTTRDLLGYGFAPSPDGKEVAHVGWISHFAPPYAKSNYLQFDHTTVYPLPNGMVPFEQTGLRGPPKVVSEQGLTYSGIHEFRSAPIWSPDSQNVALIDCVYDWTANSPQSMSAGDGKESNRHCSIAVVSRNGRARLFRLDDVTLEELSSVILAWVGPDELELRADDATKTITLK